MPSHRKVRTVRAWAVVDRFGSIPLSAQNSLPMIFEKKADAVDACYLECRVEKVEIRPAGVEGVGL